MAKVPNVNCIHYDNFGQCKHKDRKGECVFVSNRQAFCDLQTNEPSLRCDRCCQKSYVMKITGRDDYAKLCDICALELKGGEKNET